MRETERQQQQQQREPITQEIKTHERKIRQKQSLNEFQTQKENDHLALIMLRCSSYQCFVFLFLIFIHFSTNFFLEICFSAQTSILGIFLIIFLLFISRFLIFFMSILFSVYIFIWNFTFFKICGKINFQILIKKYSKPKLVELSIEHR